MAYDLVKVHCEKRFKRSGDLVERMKYGEDKKGGFCLQTSGMRKHRFADGDSV